MTDPVVAPAGNRVHAGRDGDQAAVAADVEAGEDPYAIGDGAVDAEEQVHAAVAGLGRGGQGGMAPRPGQALERLVAPAARSMSRAASPAPVRRPRLSPGRRSNHRRIVRRRHVALSCHRARRGRLEPGPSGRTGRPRAASSRAAPSTSWSLGRAGRSTRRDVSPVGTPGMVRSVISGPTGPRRSLVGFEPLGPGTRPRGSVPPASVSDPCRKVVPPTHGRNAAPSVAPRGGPRP